MEEIKVYNLEINLQEINILLGGLGELPTKIALPLVLKINKLVNKEPISEGLEKPSKKIKKTG